MIQYILSILVWTFGGLPRAWVGSTILILILIFLLTPAVHLPRLIIRCLSQEKSPSLRELRVVTVGLLFWTSVLVCPLGLPPIQYWAFILVINSACIYAAKKYASP